MTRYFRHVCPRCFYAECRAVSPRTMIASSDIRRQANSESRHPDRLNHTSTALMPIFRAKARRPARRQRHVPATRDAARASPAAAPPPPFDAAAAPPRTRL